MWYTIKRLEPMTRNINLLFGIVSLVLLIGCSNPIAPSESIRITPTFLTVKVGETAVLTIMDGNDKPLSSFAHQIERGSEFISSISINGSQIIIIAKSVGNITVRAYRLEEDKFGDRLWVSAIIKVVN